MKSRLLVAALIASASASCISRKAADPSWPAAVPLRQLSQLDGSYRLADEGSSRDLYGFFNGALGRSHPMGDHVKLKAAPDGQTLEVQLQDRHGKLLENSQLHSGEDFILADKHLSLKVPGGVGTTGATNLGAFAGDASVILSKAESGGLLGKQSESSVGLIFFMVPFAGAELQHFYWPPRAE